MKKILIILVLIPLLCSCKYILGDDDDSQTPNIILLFQFTAADNAGLTSTVTCTISGTDIECIVPHGTDITGLIATFRRTTGIVTVNDIEQESAVTANDFTGTVDYTLSTNLKGTKTYTVTVIISPAVSSVSPDESATDIALDSSITVTFTKAISPSTVTVNASDTTCSGSFQLSTSSANFATCIKMSSSITTSSDNKTFTVSAAENLPGLTTYLLRVTTDIEDSDGNPLPAAYTMSTGFTTRPGPLTGDWNFIDGDGANGMNKEISKAATYPHIVSFNSKLYTAWKETNGTNDQIRVAEWDGASNWNLVDGNGSNGINRNTAQDAEFPNLAVFNGELFAAWDEINSSSKKQIRIAKWDGVSSWSFVDGNDSENGINKNNGMNALRPWLASYNSKLYIAWYETNGSDNQIRVAEWDGSSSWSFVDGNVADGINYNTSDSATSPQLYVFDSKLYATWNETNAAYNIRVAEWNGSSNWNFVDGNDANGINKDGSQNAILSRLSEFNSKLYATWYEASGAYQIRVAEWDGTSTWNFVDGDGATGINKETGITATTPHIIPFNLKLYVSWTESNGTNYQIRAAEWDGSSSWSFVDGDGANGINKDIDENAQKAMLIEFDSKLIAIWEETSGGVSQIRAAAAETE